MLTNPGCLGIVVIPAAHMFVDRLQGRLVRMLRRFFGRGESVV